MKVIFTLLLLAAAFLPRCAFSQLSNGGLYANFGVDADTRGDYMKYGIVSGSVASDDWFASSASGINVIDTANAGSYRSSLQAGVNLSFNKRMSVPLYSKINGKLWLDAAYGRDYMAASSLKDSTTFTIACKNGNDPSTWVGGVSSFPDKNDLVDVCAHMRRDGERVDDSLWLFTGVSTYGTSGSRYFDVELYKKSFTYNSTTGQFSSAGTDGGHTQWLFDAGGNLIQTGDMILAVSYSPGSAPVVDVRIWVSQTTWSSVVPADFNFNSSFDGSGGFGYASIVSKAGATAFGAGIANYSGTSAQDTTYSCPWGTTSSGGWSLQYQSLQFIEIGLNLTRIGLDPALYTALGASACESLFSNIFFKSRSSTSFTSNMQDFMVPLAFLRDPVMDYTLQPDTLRCNRSQGTIDITNNTTAGYYTWQTADGNISGSNGDSTAVDIDQPGTYIVSASPAEGCPATRTDTVVIPIDTFPPVASIDASVVGNYAYLQFYGGDVAASNYSTPFGGSDGLLWDWSGPEGFSSTIQNPATSDTAWGTYQLIVTEKRNGCKDTAVKAFDITDFIVLLSQDFRLAGSYANGGVILRWSDLHQGLAARYEIERSTPDKGFLALGAVAGQTVSVGRDGTLFSFVDDHPLTGDNIYRIRAIMGNGQSYYSNRIHVEAGRSGRNDLTVFKGASDSHITLIATASTGGDASIAVYDLSGKLLLRQDVYLRRGVNTFSVPATGVGPAGTVRVVSLLEAGRVACSKKIVF